MFTKRTLRVSIPCIEQALSSKEEFDALAFCVLVKLNITSSVILDKGKERNTTMRRLKEITRLGNERIKRILTYCQQHGMVALEKGKIIFNKLSSDDKCYYYKIRYGYKKRKGNTLERFRITLTQVKDMLRRAVLAKHIKLIQDIRETAKLTKCPKCVDEYRKGKRLLRRLSVWGFNFFISNKCFADTVNCSLSKARAIKRNMIKSKEVDFAFSNTLFYNDAKKFNVNQYKKFIGTDCFLFERDGKIYKHNPNIYSYKGDKLLFVPKNNK